MSEDFRSYTFRKKEESHGARNRLINKLRAQNRYNPIQQRVQGKQLTVSLELTGLLERIIVSNNYRVTKVE